MTGRAWLAACVLLAGCATNPDGPAVPVAPPVPLAQQAQAASAAGNHELARELYTRALQEGDAENTEALAGRGRALLALRRTDEARADFSSALAHNPANVVALEGMGLVEDLANRHEAAVQWYQKALALAPARASIYNNYGYSRLMVRDYAGAEKILHEGLSREPGNELLRANLVLAVAWQGEYQRAVRLGSPNGRNAVACNDVGYVAMTRGDVDIAIRLFEEAIEVSPVWFARAASNLERARSLRSQQRAAAGR